MIDGQYNIFDMLYPKYKITKPIRMLTFFSGYDSQCLAMKYLGANYECYKTCEWAVKSIQALKDIHFTDDNTDYSKGIEMGQIKEFLFNKGISQNYNEPMTMQQIQRLSEKQAREIYNNIQITHNLVNIQQVKGEDLCIKDTNKFTYLLTYSFPCQDLSLAGKGKGMSDTSTRSGMLWEVERILTECNELGTLPECLLMENVPQVHSEDNLEDFNKWKYRLEELGYKNYFQDLIATDYGIPQTRNRCFMVSILGDYSYNFPKPIPLKLKLKDLLEDNVDEKYFLSDKMLDYMYSESSGGISRKEMFERNFKDGDIRDTAATITTNNGQRASDTFIRIKNATKQGYLDAEDGDGIDISSRMEHHRGNVQKDKIQTLTTSGGNDRGVVVDTLKKDLCNKLIQDGLVEEGDVVKHSYTQQILDGNKKCVEKNDGNMITLTTRGDCVGVCVKPKVLGGIGEKDSNNNTQWKQQNRIYDDNVSISITTAFNPYYKSDLRIRKLTPRECGRLMNVKDEDIDKIHLSDSAMYHIFGDSICSNVLMAIFGELLDIDWKTKLEEMLNK